MKLTKLEIVQRTLSAIGSENVSAIGDTIESEEVSFIVDTLYEEILADYPWPFLAELIQPEITSDVHTFRIPVDVYQINWIRYKGTPVGYIDPYDMQDITQGTGQPRFWSSVDDDNIIVDRVEDDTSGSDFSIEAIKIPGKLLNDTDQPELPARFFPTFLYGCFAQAASILKKDYDLYSVYKQKYQRGMIDMKRWALKARRPTGPGDLIDYSRKRGNRVVSYRYGS